MTIELTFENGIEELINDFALAAKISPSILVSRIMSGRCEEMCELLEFATFHQHDPSKRLKVAHLLRDYDGGEYVFRAMKETDPQYQSPEEMFMSIGDHVLEDLVASLDNHSRKSSQ